MPVLPNFVERILLRLRPELAPLLDIWGVGAFEAVQHAAYLGVFEAIHAGAVTPSEIAKRIRADERGTVLLLDALEAFGYMKQRDGRYSLTKASDTFFKDPSLVSQDVFWLYKNLYQFWREHEEDAVRTGRPSVNIFEWFNQHPNVWKLFHSFELGLAKQVGSRVASDAKIPESAKRLIDVGGGHGMYSLLFCKQYPNLTATVFDSPRPLEDAKKLIDMEKMSGRMSVQEGDFLRDDLGRGYDVALLFDVMHLFDRETNHELLRRVAASLNPGGLVVIFDQLKGGEFGKVLRAAHAYYGLLFLITTGGQLYTYQELSELLSGSGFKNVRRKQLRAAGSTIVTATRG